MSLILRVGWVWTLEKYVTKFYVTNWEGRVGLNPNMYDVTLFSLFFFEGFPNKTVMTFSIVYFFTIILQSMRYSFNILSSFNSREFNISVGID